MSRLPIRVRLAAAFAAALAVVLALAGLFVYVRVSDALDESIDDRLGAIIAGAGTVAGDAVPGLDAAAGAEAEEGFAQILGPRGEVVASTLPSDAGAALRPQQVDTALRTGLRVEQRVRGVDGQARIGAVASDDGERVVVAGVSTEDRAETLGELRAAFLIGAPLAVLLAAALCYLIAGRALRPVEAMRRRAARVSFEHGGERLPLPRARDELRRLGETLNDMLDRLQASFERERRFVADASHELRTPLAVLKTELEAALRLGGHSPQVQESLSAAVEEADQLGQLADDLLLLARASDEGLPVRRERLAVRELLERSAERFADRAHGRGRTISVEASEGLEAELDPLRVRQAVGNLIDNALRHGDGEIRLSARERNGAVEIDVSDAGPGFPPALRARAFERFARGDAARARGGAGLGLAIVSAIADAHGGSAAIVQQAPSTVRLTLPGSSQGRLSGTA